MTLDEAINKMIENNKSLGSFESKNLKLLNEIYADFKSRICKNCKLTAGGYYIYACNVLLAFTQEQAEEIINSGFGCNRFETKDER